MSKPTTCKASHKRYQCTACGHVEEHQTNHYGEIYPRCRKCGWKRPMEMGQRHVCLETVPEGMGVPEPWKMTKLGDVCEIITIPQGKKL